MTILFLLQKAARQLCKISKYYVRNVIEKRAPRLSKKRLTKRAPDAGDSAHIPSSFTHLIIFLVGRLRRPRPSAGNANRWALGHF